jgi:hypothetical protein
MAVSVMIQALPLSGGVTLAEQILKIILGDFMP